MDHRWILRGVLSICVRLGLAFSRCREEQVPHCIGHNLHRNLTSLTNSDEWIICGRILLALATCVGLYAVFQRSVGRISRITVLSVGLMWGHWILEATSVLVPGVGIDPSSLKVLPQVFYLVFAIGLCRRVFLFVGFQNKDKVYPI